MKKIFKYQLARCVLGQSNEKFLLPARSQLLSVKIQDGLPHAWFVVDTYESRKEEFVFTTCWTGQPIDIPDGSVFVATLLYEDGLVEHIFLS